MNRHITWLVFVLLVAVCFAGGPQLLETADAQFIINPYRHGGVVAPTDYAHYWNPASLDETDQVGSRDADSHDFNADATYGWNIGSVAQRYIRLNGVIANGRNYTITMWLRPHLADIATNAYGGFVMCERLGTPGTKSDYVLTCTTTGVYKMGVYNSAGSYVADSQTAGTTYTWQHLAAVVNDDDNTLQVFVNGESDGSTAMTITPNDAYVGGGSYNRTTLGTWSWSTPGDGRVKYEGQIGKVRFYKRCLSLAEIQAEILADGETGP